MKVRRTTFPALAGLLTLGVLAAPAPARAPGLAALREVEPGQWLLRDRDATSGGHAICIASGDELLMLGHRGANCTRRVIEDTAESLTVTYQCQGSGAGRTAMRIETARLLAIETQGVNGGRPFDHSYQARRVGTCPAGAVHH